MAGQGDKKDYYSFDEVLKDLQMEEDDLKRLVSAGEIRAFRDRDTMRFKAEDIERIRKGAGAGKDAEIDLGEELDLGEDLDLGEGDELVLEDDDVGGGEEVPVRPGAEEIDLAAGDPEAGRSSTPQRRVPRSKAAEQAPEGATEGAGMQFVLGFGFVVLILANFAALGAAAGQTNALTDFLSNMFGG